MSTKPTPVIDAVKKYYPVVRQRVIHAETVIKSIGVTVASGAALTAHDLLLKTEKIEDIFTPAGVIRIKHNLVYGGMLSLFGLFIKSPVKPATQDQVSGK